MIQTHHDIFLWTNRGKYGFSKGFHKGKKRDRMAGQKSAPEGGEFQEITHTFQTLVNKNKIPKIPKFKNLTLKCSIKFGQSLTPPFFKLSKFKRPKSKVLHEIWAGPWPPPYGHWRNLSGFFLKMASLIPGIFSRFCQHASWIKGNMSNMID